MRICPITSLHQNSQSQKTNFKGLWGEIISTKHIGSEMMYGNEVHVDRYVQEQAYHPFSDETEQMTAKVLSEGRYKEVCSNNYCNVEATEILPVVKPKLPFTAQRFIDYVTGNCAKEFYIDNIETHLKDLNLTKYIKKI